MSEEVNKKHCIACQALGMQKAVDVMLSRGGSSTAAFGLCWELNRVLEGIGSPQSLRIRAEVTRSDFGDRVSWYCEVYTDTT
jgi:hypothetical protein